MDDLWKELARGLPDLTQLTHIVLHLALATVLGGLVGLERERMGKPAGLRTHILVCLGTVVFILSCAEAGISSDALSRVVQGIVAGIGFIGAGSILKISERQDVHGLTTAAGIWMTAAIGVAVGLGRWGVAVLSTLCILLILSVARRFEHRSRLIELRTKNGPDDSSDPNAAVGFYPMEKPSALP